MVSSLGFVLIFSFVFSQTKVLRLDWKNLYIVPLAALAFVPSFQGTEWDVLTGPANDFHPSLCHV